LSVLSTLKRIEILKSKERPCSIRAFSVLVLPVPDYAERSAENERRVQLYDLAITLEPPVMYNLSTFF